MRQDSIHPQEEVVTEERDTHLNSQEVSWVSIYAVTPPLWRKQRGSKDPLDDCESGEWKILFKTQCSKTWDHGIQSHHFVASRWGNNGNSDKLDFLRLQNHCRWWLQPWNEKMFVPWKRSYDKSRQHIKKQRHYFGNRGLSGQSYGFPSSHVWLWEVDHKESWALKNSCFWNVVLEKTLESPLDCKKIKPVYPKGNQYWIFIGRTDAEAPILWPPDAKNWLILKTMMLRKIECRRRGQQRMRWLDGITDWWTWVWTCFGSFDGQGKLACCSSQRFRHDWAIELKWRNIYT